MQGFLYKLAAIISPGQVNIPKSNPTNQLTTILQIVFGIAGGVALIIITIAGIRMIMSMGNPESFSRARNTIIYAVVGLVICIFAFSIVTFVVNKI